jgi:hypothetical protein
MTSGKPVQTPVTACPFCTHLDVAHVGDTETSRWLECRRCGHVWSQGLDVATATEFDGWRADTDAGRSRQAAGSRRRSVDKGKSNSNPGSQST